MFKMLIITGHSATKPGASGNGFQEHELNIELGKLIQQKMLARFNCIVDLYDTTRNAYDDVNNKNFNVDPRHYDYVLEIHFNAYSDKTANGTEIYVTTLEKVIAVETAIMDALRPFFKIRGVKVKDFNVIKFVKNNGVSSALIETAFITNEKDISTYQARKQEIANAIATAIGTSFGLDKIQQKPTATVKDEIKSLLQKVGELIETL